MRAVITPGEEATILERRSNLTASSTAFVLAGLVATTLHEAAHFVAAALLGAHAELFPPFVSLDEVTSESHVAIIASTGPLFSLVSGLVLIAAFRRFESSFVTLFVLWLGFLSAQIGFGYLLVSPLNQGGDTGYVISTYADNIVVYLAAVAIGAAGSYLLLPRLFSATVSPWVDSKAAFFRTGMYPWIIGTVVLLVIYAVIEGVILDEGTDLFFSLLGTAAIGIFTPIANYRTATTPSNQLAVQRPLAGIAVTVVVATVIIAGLTQGIEINR